MKIIGLFAIFGYRLFNGFYDFAGNAAVEFGMSCLIVRQYPQSADTEAESAEKEPADEAETEAEELPFFAFHKVFAGSDAFKRGILGMVELYVVCHAVRIALDDAGDDEEQAPEEREHVDEDAEKEAVGKGLGKAVEDLADLRFFACVNVFDEYLGKTVGKRSDDKDGNEGRNAGDDAEYEECK